MRRGQTYVILTHAKLLGRLARYRPFCDPQSSIKPARLRAPCSPVLSGASRFGGVLALTPDSLAERSLYYPCTGWHSEVEAL